MPLKNIFPHLKNAQKIAESYGGYCLSDIYINSKEKLKWKCQHEDHKVWLATYKKVVDKGLWCVECGCDNVKHMNQPSIDLTINSAKGNDRQEKQLEKAKKHAESKDGKCLSEMYVKSSEKLTWKCKHDNHKPWDAIYKNVVNNGRWCPECGAELISNLLRNSNGLEMAKNYAESKDGKCLSEIYMSNKAKLTWKCKHDNHKPWDARYKDVVNGGRWCPECGSYRNVSEFRVRLCLEKIFGTVFKKRRNLEWNKNQNTNRLLELDGYSEELGIAFEYQGEQHHTKTFQTDKDFHSLKENDRLKIINCKNNSVKLIIIDAPIERVKRSPLDFYGHILAEIKKSGIKCNHKLSESDIKSILFSGPENDHNEKQLEIAEKHAEIKGGKCLSEMYVKSSEKLTWKCKHDNHKPWDARYKDVVNGDLWCPECGKESRANSRRNSNGLEVAKKHAESKDGKCLSEMYVKSSEKLTWKCKHDNHKPWDARYGNVVNNGSWCPECSRITLKDK